MFTPGRPSLRRSDRARRSRPRRRTAGGPCLLLAIALSIGPQSAVGGKSANPPADDPFAIVVATGTNLTPFRKWQSALQRYRAEELAAKAGSCEDGAPDAPACVYATWARFLDSLRGKSHREQLQAVNREVNRHPYVTDVANWAADDYWETPGEFLTRSGDCEDFAILKFLSLRQLGWSGESLRVAAVYDTRLDIGHAVVVVEDAGRTWILDNQIPDVVEAESVAHYQPVYSVTESSWRLHRSPERTTTGPGRRGIGGSDGQTPGTP